MSRRRLQPDTVPVIALARRAEARPGDDRLDLAMTACLREGAMAREVRDQARSAEETRDFERMTAELRTLIDGHPENRDTVTR